MNITINFNLFMPIIVSSNITRLIFIRAKLGARQKYEHPNSTEFEQLKVYS